MSLFEAMVRAAATVPGIEDPRVRQNHEPSFWLRWQLASLDTDLVSGDLTYCGHEGPHLVALWHSDRAVCVSCAGGELDLSGTAEDCRCDRCGEYADPIEVCLVGAPRFLVSFGLCGNCAAREVIR